MLILLPPSEGKFAPARGRPLDLDTLSFPTLGPTRNQVLHALVELCGTDPSHARKTLGLPPGLYGETARNAALRTAPTATAGRIYTGVLYDSLALHTLSPRAKRRASSRLAVTSALFGLIRVGDRIPSYRLSADTTLPGLGTLASVWRQPLDTVLGPETDKQLIVDLRSTVYTALWRPPERARQVVAVRVLHEVRGRRTVLSHANKATKGRVVRALLEDGANPRTPHAFAELLAALGWRIEPTPGQSDSIDIVVAER